MSWLHPFDTAAPASFPLSPAKARLKTPRQIVAVMGRGANGLSAGCEQLLVFDGRMRAGRAKQLPALHLNLLP